MAEHTTLDQREPVPQISGVARAALVLGIISIPLCFLLVPAITALILALTAEHQVKKSPALRGGLGHAKAGFVFALTSLIMGLALAILFPSLGRVDEIGRRSYCAGNLRGIMQSCNIYAADNSDSFPLVPYAPFTAGLNNPTATSGAASAGGTFAGIYGTPPASVAGSPVASIWILVINQQLSTKQLLCKADPFVGSTAAPQIVGDLYQTNFSNGNRLSYSFAYPWTADGRRGGWWRDITDSTLPLISDMTPLQGTGTPARVLNPASTPANSKTWNSVNHGGDGQYVGYSDVHANFERSPNIGQNDDNIFTTSGTGLPQQFVGTPATPLFAPIPALPPATGSAEYGGPFDIIMVPVRNATTGAM